jgi:hypothetical protein
MMTTVDDDNDNLAGKVSIEEGVNNALDAFMMRLKAGNAVAVDPANNHDNIARDAGGSSSEKGELLLPSLLTAADNRNRWHHVLQQPASSYIDSSGSMVRIARTSINADIRAI